MLLAGLARRRASRAKTLAASDEPASPPSSIANRVVDQSTVGDHESTACEEACPLATAVDSTAANQISGDGDQLAVDSQSISIDQLRRLWSLKEPVTILDVRTDRSLVETDQQAKDAVRMPPDHVVERAKEFGLRTETWLIAYCA